MQRWFDFKDDARLDLVRRDDGVPVIRLRLKEPLKPEAREAVLRAGWVVYAGERDFDHYGNPQKMSDYKALLLPFFSAERILDALTDEPFTPRMPLHAADLQPQFQENEWRQQAEAPARDIGVDIRPTWSAEAVSDQIWQDHEPPSEVRELVERVRGRVPSRMAVIEKFLTPTLGVIEWLERASSQPSLRQFQPGISKCVSELAAAADAFDIAMEAIEAEAQTELGVADRLSLAHRLEHEMILLVEEHTRALEQIEELSDSMLGWIEPRHMPDGDISKLIQASWEAYRGGERLDIATLCTVPELHNVATRIERIANLAWPENANLKFLSGDAAKILLLLDQEMAEKRVYNRYHLGDLETIVLSDLSGPIAYSGSVRLANNLREIANELDHSFDPKRVAFLMKEIVAVLERTSSRGERLSARKADEISSQLWLAAGLLDLAGDKNVPEDLRSAEFGVSIVRGIASAGALVPPENLAIARDQLEHIAAVLSDGRYLALDVREARERQRQLSEAATTCDEVVKAVLDSWRREIDRLDRSLNAVNDPIYISPDSNFTFTREEYLAKLEIMRELVSRMEVYVSGMPLNLSISASGSDVAPERLQSTYLLSVLDYHKADLQALRKAGVEVETGFVAANPEPADLAAAERSEAADIEAVRGSIAMLSEHRQAEILRRVDIARQASGFGKAVPANEDRTPFAGGALPLWGRLLARVPADVATAGIIQGLELLKRGSDDFPRHEELLLAVADGSVSPDSLAASLPAGALARMKEFSRMDEQLGELMPPRAAWMEAFRQMSPDLPFTVFDGTHSADTATAEAIAFAGVGGKPTQRLRMLDQTLPRPLVDQVRVRLANAIAFMQRQLGLAHDGGLPELFADKPFQIMITRDATLDRSADGVAQRRGVATQVRLSPFARGAAMHELGHILDFCRPNGQRRLYELLHDTGAVESTARLLKEVGPHIWDGDPAPQTLAYYMSPVEIFARSVSAGMRASLAPGDVFGREAGGTFAVELGFDFEPTSAVARRFVEELRAELQAPDYGNEHSFSAGRAPGM